MSLNRLSCVCLVVFLGLAGQCSLADDTCPRLTPSKYEYYGTKTIYADARRLFHCTDKRDPSCHGKTLDDLPKSYDDDSLKEEHEDLVKDGKCKPMVFYFVGRHSARFPDSEEIAQLNADISGFVKKLQSSTCKDKIGELLKWKTKMDIKHDNLITELGEKEEQSIASRFKKIYPDFFNASKADVQYGVTNQIRTAQTGLQFLRQVADLNLPHCDHHLTPTNNIDLPEYDADKILNSKCYSEMMKNHGKKFLSFHEECKKINGEEKIRDPLVEILRKATVEKRIADRVARRLGLDNSSEKPPVDAKLVRSMHDMCKFENAFANDSVWCNVFDKHDLEALEYIEDAKTYIQGAYGRYANARQSCMLVSEMLQALHDGTKMSDNERKKSYFYFSHASPMKKLLGTFGVFRDDDSFSERRIRAFENELKIPSRRHWRVSLLTPFSGNMAFTLYKCQKKRGGEIKFKILATVNEQPVKLSGCGDTDCNARKFFEAFDNLSDCDMRKICSKSSTRNHSEFYEN